MKKTSDRSDNSRLVYSTESGPIKPTQAADVAAGTGDGIVRLFRESRKGNGVTLVKGLPSHVDIKAIAKHLKKRLGAGGSIKNGVIEVQTDQREKIKTLLEKQGLHVKIAGG